MHVGLGVMTSHICSVIIHWKGIHISSYESAAWLSIVYDISKGASQRS